MDLRALTQLIRGIDQVKELQQLNISIQLSKNTTRSANFLFRISNATLIGSVNSDTPLKTLVTFHILPVHKSFLLYLADIDKLGIFFHNITNEVIHYK